MHSQSLLKTALPCQVSFNNVSLASVERDAELLEEVVKLGSDVMNSKMLQCARMRNYELVFYFLEHGADINYVKGTEDIFRETVLLFALLKRCKCDQKCLKRLLDAGARFHYEDQNSTIFRSAFRSESNVFKFLIKERVEIPDLWMNILKYQKLDLFEDALKVGYELDMETRKILIVELLKLQKFNKVGMFLDVPEEEQRKILFFTLYEIDLIFEENQTQDPELRQQLKDFEQLVVMLIMALED